MNWRIGASTGCAMEHPISEAVTEIQRAGITGIEVATPPRHFDPARIREVASLDAQLRAHGTEPVSVHAPFGGLLDLSDFNPHHRHAAIGAIVTASSALLALGGRIVVVHPTDVKRDGENVGERLANCVGSLQILSRSLGAMGLVLAVESPLPHLVGGDVGEFRHIMEQVDGAGICLDTSHATLGRQWNRFVEAAGARLIHVHANDHKGQYDDHLAPGDGIIDWAEIGSDLKRLNYRGWLMLELNCIWGPSGDYFSRARNQLLERLEKAI